MIRFKISLDSPKEFVVLVAGENVQIVKNPALTASLPYWLQQHLANSALQRVYSDPPRKLVRRVAEVVALDALRQAREVRVSKNSVVGT